MIEENRIYNMDCLEGLRQMPDKSVDLIVTDPPYLIKGIHEYNKTELGRSATKSQMELKNAGITNGFDWQIVEEMFRVMKKPNIYIWCNITQVPMYINYFVNQKKCKMDILVWNKTNAMPLFNNRYMSDKEYCLYFRKGGYCSPANYNDAKTVFTYGINIKDKNTYGHPTIKPFPIIEILVKNSSRENEVVLDPFMGSGTTATACIRHNRKYIGFEVSGEYYETALKRIENEKK